MEVSRMVVAAELQTLRVKDVTARLGVSRMTLWRWMRDHGFPRPIKVGGRNGAALWRPDEIDRWLDHMELRQHQADMEDSAA